MAAELLDHIGTYIKANNGFFNSFKVNAIQLPSGEVIEFSDGVEKKFIGIGDNFGTAGYIRFSPNITHSVNARRLTSVKSSESFIKDCRLVAFTWDLKKFTPERLMTKLIGDLKQIQFSTSNRRPNIRVKKSNPNYLDVFKEEYLKEIKDSGNAPFICISIDFDLQYYPGECELCEPYNPDNKYVLIINQDGDIVARRTPPETYEVLQFSGIRDSGSPYTNSIVDNS